jgi:hypothetical protein
MLTRSVRLGDDIDDFCVKCKRVMNHSVVSILQDAPAKVRCRTCHSDHDFRNEQPPPPKVDARKAALFNEVLGNVTALPADGAPDGKPADQKAGKASDEKPSKPAADVKAKATAAPEPAEAEAPRAPKTKAAAKTKPAVKAAKKSK